jgi:hypothetical protein
MTWDSDLPDVSQWKPRYEANDKLANLFFNRCKQAEASILLRAGQEREGNLDNFCSGPGVEEIVREELSKILPTRYTVTAGTLDDRYGKTAGDCDVVIFNSDWFPTVRAGATGHSRNQHFPIEGVYAVIEIKSALNFKILDDAVEKLVKCHRLHRPSIHGDRLNENRCFHRTGPPEKLVNPLYSAVLATGLDNGIEFDDIANRFFAICKRLNRPEVPHALCVVNEATLTWGVRGNNEAKPAIFHDDYSKPIFPSVARKSVIGSAFYPFINSLLLSLQHMILSPDDLPTKYGLNKHTISIPTDASIALSPSEIPHVMDPEARE